MRALAVVGLAGIVAAGCNCGSSSGALSIHVDLNDSDAKCVIAGVTLDGTTTQFHNSPAVDRKGKSSLVFGVEPNAMIKGKVVPFARGYKSSDCAGLSFDAFDESAVASSSVDLGLMKVQSVTLALQRAVTGTDAGSDGGSDAGTDAGAGDAGTDGGCVPAVAELCADGIDNTCDGLVDCADPACVGQACAGAGTCGTATDGGKLCVQPTETSCADLTDNDQNGLTDCEDPACMAKACNDGDLCTTTDFCGPGADGGGFCDAGAGRVSCVNTTMGCKAGLGVCAPATGLCAYASLDAGTSCDDGVLCTHDDLCNGSGTCAGTAYSCSSSACASNPQCDGLGGCSYTFAPPTTVCDDTNLCTHTDLCGDGGICSGQGYSCANPPVCFSGTACFGDGGCDWTFNGVDSGCPGGVCGVDGGCVPNPVWSYAPNNFNLANIPDASIASRVQFTGACDAGFDSTNNTFLNWCGQPQPTPIVFTQDNGTDGGISTTLLAMSAFDVGPNAMLTLSGSRPVIFAVYGGAVIEGTIDARSLEGGRLGPGGSWSSCATMNGGNATGNAGGGGAGFGSAGGNGATAGFGAGGVASANKSLVPLHGGCHGGRGNDANNGPVADGGNGGGAFQLSVAGTLTIDGILSVSGAGGQGGTLGGALDDNGGGGAGSGGALFLEARALDLLGGARLIANGGAGGGGRQDNNPVASPGQNGSLDTAVPALGGQRGSPPAGDGGTGAAGSSGPGPAVPGIGNAGGGGGGAGLGIIRLRAANRCSIDGGAVLSGTVTKAAPCP